MGELVPQRDAGERMFTLVTTVPVAKSICEGTPTPIASGSPASRITSRTTCSTPSSSASALRHLVGCSAAWAAPTPSTAATATLVPPTSTPRTTPNSYLRNHGPASLADYACPERSGTGSGCPLMPGTRLEPMLVPCSSLSQRSSPNSSPASTAGSSPRATRPGTPPARPSTSLTTSGLQRSCAWPVPTM